MTLQGKITDAQQRYLRILLNEAFAKRYQHGLLIDPAQLGGMSAQDASTAIARLVEAKQRGWTGQSHGYHPDDEARMLLAKRVAGARLHQEEIRRQLAGPLAPNERAKHERWLQIRTRAETIAMEEIAQRRLRDRPSTVPTEDDIEQMGRLYLKERAQKDSE